MGGPRLSPLKIPLHLQRPILPTYPRFLPLGFCQLLPPGKHLSCAKPHIKSANQNLAREGGRGCLWAHAVSLGGQAQPHGHYGRDTALAWEGVLGSTSSSSLGQIIRPLWPSIFCYVI